MMRQQQMASANILTSHEIAVLLHKYPDEQVLLGDLHQGSSPVVEMHNSGSNEGIVMPTAKLHDCRK